jgi:hypothetical protein
MNELTTAVLKLIDITEGLEKRLRLYDATLRFIEANSPNEASNFKAHMSLVSLTPGLTDECVHPELDRLGERVRQLVVRIAQDSDNPPKP